jgi:hypothetical protein
MIRILLDIVIKCWIKCKVLNYFEERDTQKLKENTSLNNHKDIYIYIYIYI